MTVSWLHVTRRLLRATHNVTRLLAGYVTRILLRATCNVTWLLADYVTRILLRATLNLTGYVTGYVTRYAPPMLFTESISNSKCCQCRLEPYSFSTSSLVKNFVPWLALRQLATDIMNSSYVSNKHRSSLHTNRASTEIKSASVGSA